MASRRRHLAAHRAARDELLSALGEDPATPAGADPGDGKAVRGPRRPRRRSDRGQRPARPARSERRAGRRSERRGVRPDTATRDRRWVWWTVGWAVAAAGVCVAVGLGAPTLGHGSDIRFVIAGVAAVVSGAALAAGHRPDEGRRGRTSVPVVAAAAALCFAVGASSSVIIDGRPVLATSTEARAHAMVRAMEADMLALVEADEMISLPISEARARSREYEELAAEMESLSARWSKTHLSELPTGEFAPVGTSLATASFAAAQAVEAKISLLGSNDARVTAEMNAARQTLVSEVLAAGPQLVALGELYDVEVNLGAPKVKE